MFKRLTGPEAIEILQNYVKVLLTIDFSDLTRSEARLLIKTLTPEAYMKQRKHFKRCVEEEQT